jgi:hypothetical protein
MKIGFIDHYLDEWHATNFPALIRHCAGGERFTVALAFEETTPPGKKAGKTWCREQSVPAATSIEEVVDTCDALIVFAPDNPETHERLADLPLRSGKPVFIDKPFAPSLAAAERMTRLAAEYGTPLMTSSSLRFTPAWSEGLARTLGGRRARFASLRGPGCYDLYAVHQLELLVMALGPGARRALRTGDPSADLLLIDYADGRHGLINLIASHEFAASVAGANGELLTLTKFDGYFEALLPALLSFFATRRSPVPPEETREIFALQDAGRLAAASPGVWVPVST